MDSNQSKCLVVFIVLLLLMIFMTSCTNLPSHYRQYVVITDGPFKGKPGTLMKDCSGFENYQVEVWGYGDTCVRIWNMEAY